VLGPGWDPAGRIFVFFGPGVGIMLLYGTHGWIHLSIGTADRWFRWVMVEFSVTFLLFLLGLRWGPEGMAMAWTASFWILTLPAFWYAGKPIEFGVGAVVTAVWKYVIASLLAGGATAVAMHWVPPAAAASGWIEALVHLAVTSVLFLALYLVGVVVLYRGFAPFYQLGGLIREMIPWSRLAKPRPEAVAETAQVL
jgi:polysaccharide transporter, PST family